MATGQLGGFLRHLRTATLLQEASGVTDAQLLDSFIARKDQATFAALVRRHGPMVWGVSCRILSHIQDAEDAFQATFLVLVRKATSVVPRAMAGNWLNGVAYRTAIKQEQHQTGNEQWNDGSKSCPKPRCHSKTSGLICYRCWIKSWTAYRTSIGSPSFCVIWKERHT